MTSLFILSICDLVGANLVCKSFAAFCPSLVARIAFWMWMIPTFVGVDAAWALASIVMPSASAGREINVFFKAELLKFETNIAVACQNVRPIVNRNVERFS